MKAQNSNQEITTLLEEQLEPLIQQVMASFEMAGLAIGIVRGDEVVYVKGFGVKHLETREPVTATSLFHLASVSKPFVATAIMQLAEQGKLDLDTPIVRYLPYMSRHLLRPLGMSTSTFFKHEVPAELGVTPHVSVPQIMLSPVYPYDRAHAPSSTLHSSAREMCQWARANLQKGSLNGKRILSAASYDRLWHPYAPIEEGDP